MINEPTILVTILLAGLTFFVPRKHILLPYVLAACLVPADQRIIIMDLDFSVLRILVVTGVIRLLMNKELTPVRWTRFDKLIAAWACCGALIYILQWRDISAIINRSGFLFDVLGMYWLFRHTLRSFDDLKRLANYLAVCAVILVPLVAVEWTTGRNPFSMFGRVSTATREGLHRCQAAFPHSIMLGLFWATLIPVFIGLARTGYNKILHYAAAAAGIFIIFCTASSTPMIALVLAVLFLPVFRYRRYGRLIAYCTGAGIVALHIVMRAPVWNLIARVNVMSGSTGYYRYKLIDTAIKHFGDWALLGTRSTEHWGAGLGDITNQYILEGVRGGLITLVLFIILLVAAVQSVGRYSLRPMPPRQQFFIWCIGVSILVHCASFFAVSYFGQMKMLLYLTFAIVGFICELSVRNAPRETAVPTVTFVRA